MIFIDKPDLYPTLTYNYIDPTFYSVNLFRYLKKSMSDNNSVHDVNPLFSRLLRNEFNQY